MRTEVVAFISFLAKITTAVTFTFQNGGLFAKDVRNDLPCKLPYGVYRYPDDCTKYYQCHRGLPWTHHQCPPGTEFSEEYNFCHWAAQVKCSYDPSKEDYDYDELSEALEISPVEAEPEYDNVLFPGCDCNGDVGDDGRGDCQKNWCYVDSDTNCTDVRDSTYSPGWVWSQNACLGRVRPLGCDCNGALTNGIGHGGATQSQRGECKKNWCYVNLESTCSDVKPSSQVLGWYWSYEACRAPPSPIISAIQAENDEDNENPRSGIN